MSETKHPRHPDAGPHLKPGDAEILQALEEAMPLYEDLIRLTDIPNFDYLEKDTIGEPIYSWDNPMGLVMKENPMPPWR